MKILHLVQKPQFRGAEIFAAQLATRAIQNGHNAILVFLYPGTAQLSFTGKTIQLNGKKKWRYLNIKAWFRLAYIIKQEHVDLVQCNAGDTLKYAVFSKLLFRWKQPIVFRNASVISRYIDNKFMKWWNGLFFRYAHRIISVSDESAADFSRLYPSQGAKIITIPIGVEAMAIDEKKDPFTFLGKSAGGPVLLHVGGFTYEKNHLRLIDIFERIAGTIPAAKLQLVGDGPLKKDMEKVVLKKGLQDKVIFYGSRADAVRFIYHANVLLLPSIIEGLPAVIQEAFLCRTPVVAYDTGGVRELVVDHLTGLLLPLNDEDGFVNAVLSVLQKPGSYGTMVENANRLLKALYTNDRIAHLFEKAYRLVINESMTGKQTGAILKKWKYQHNMNRCDR